MDSRAALNPNRGDLLLVAVCVKAGDVVIYDFYLLTCKAGVFIKDNLVLLAVLREERSIEPQGDELLTMGGLTRRLKILAFLTTLIGRNAAMMSLRLLLVQESQRGYSPFSNTYCSPLQLGCSYPTHLRATWRHEGL